MIIKKIILKNIRSYVKKEIDFPEGSILLGGDIGAGKTSVLLAIEYALFGLQPGQKASNLLRNNASSGEVYMEFEIEGKLIIVERKLKRSNKNIINNYSSITIDGKKIESSVTEVKTIIIDILGYPMEYVKKNNILYRYTVYIPQEQMKQIILEDPDSRLNILRNIFGIDKYRRIRENLVIVLNNLKESIKLFQGEIRDLDSYKEQITLKSYELKEIELKISSKETEFKSIKEKLLDSENKISELESSIKKKEEYQREIEKTLAFIKVKAESLQTLISEKNEAENLLKEFKEEFKEEDYLAILEAIKTKYLYINQLNSKINVLKGEISGIESLKKDYLSKKERISQLDLCPTCLQNVSGEHKHHISGELNIRQKESEDRIFLLKNEIDSLNFKMNKELEEKDQLEKDKINLDKTRAKKEFMDKSKIKVIELEKRIESLNKDLSMLESHLISLKQNIFSISKIDSLYKTTTEDLKNKKNIEKSIEISLAEYRKEIEIIGKNIKEIELKISSKEETKRKLNNLLELSDWLSNSFINLIDHIERNVLIKLREEFSRLFTKWFNMLVLDSSFIVRLDESFSPIILQEENEMDYSFLSGGERTAIALAYRLSLNQTINSVLSRIKTKDIIMLDEPTEGFSDLQLERMREVFSEIKVSQLIIVSHESKIESFVDHIIRIKKEGKDSIISKEN